MASSSLSLATMCWSSSLPSFLVTACLVTQYLCWILLSGVSCSCPVLAASCTAPGHVTSSPPITAHLVAPPITAHLVAPHIVLAAAVAAAARPPAAHAAAAHIHGHAQCNLKTRMVQGGELIITYCQKTGYNSLRLLRNSSVELNFTHHQYGCLLPQKCHMHMTQTLRHLK